MVRFLTPRFLRRCTYSQRPRWPHRFPSFKINKEWRSFLDRFDPNPRIATMSSYSLLRQQAFRSPAAVSMVIKISLQHLSGEGHMACTAVGVWYAERSVCRGVRRASKATEAALHSADDFRICLPFASAAERGADKSSRKISCNLGNIANAPPVT